jgi:hypothetical protein
VGLRPPYTQCAVTADRARPASPAPDPVDLYGRPSARTAVQCARRGARHHLHRPADHRRERRGDLVQPGGTATRPAHRRGHRLAAVRRRDPGRTAGRAALPDGRRRGPAPAGDVSAVAAAATRRTGAGRPVGVRAGRRHRAARRPAPRRRLRLAAGPHRAVGPGRHLGVAPPHRPGGVVTHPEGDDRAGPGDSARLSDLPEDDPPRRPRDNRGDAGPGDPGGQLVHLHPPDVPGEQPADARPGVLRRGLHRRLRPAAADARHPSPRSGRSRTSWRTWPSTIR